MKSPIMKQIEKLAEGHNAQLQRELRKLEREQKRLEERIERKEQKIRQSYGLSGAGLEKKIKEICEQNGLLCYLTKSRPLNTCNIGHVASRMKDEDDLRSKIRALGGRSFERKSIPGFIVIFPPGTKEEPYPGHPEMIVIQAPKGYIHKSTLEGSLGNLE